MMLFGNDRNEMRRYFCQVWNKQTQGQTLQPMERIIAQVIAQHPEYQALLSDPDAALEQEYSPATGKINPFLHMGLHISIQEQLNSQRPPGIMAIYHALCSRFGDSHTAEHHMMDCLMATLWDAQHNGVQPSEALYLQELRQLVNF